MKKTFFISILCLLNLISFGQANIYFHDRIDTTIFAVADTVGHGANHYYATNTNPDFNISKYVNGCTVNLFIKKGNTGSATLTLITKSGTLAAKTIKRQNGQNLSSGDLRDSSTVLLTFYGKYFRLGSSTAAGLPQVLAIDPNTSGHNIIISNNDTIKIGSGGTTGYIGNVGVGIGVHGHNLLSFHGRQGIWQTYDGGSSNASLLLDDSTNNCLLGMYKASGQITLNLDSTQKMIVNGTNSWGLGVGLSPNNIFQVGDFLNFDYAGNPNENISLGVGSFGFGTSPNAQRNNSIGYASMPVYGYGYNCSDNNNLGWSGNTQNLYGSRDITAGSYTLYNINSGNYYYPISDAIVLGYKGGWNMSSIANSILIGTNVALSADRADGCLAIGGSSDLTSSHPTNASAIGYKAVCNENNAMVLGGQNIPELTILDWSDYASATLLVPGEVKNLYDVQTGATLYVTYLDLHTGTVGLENYTLGQVHYGDTLLLNGQPRLVNGSMTADTVKFHNTTVGIGTTSPDTSYRLHVVGNERLDGGLNSNPNAGTGFGGRVIRNISSKLVELGDPDNDVDGDYVSINNNTGIVKIVASSGIDATTSGAASFSYVKISTTTYIDNAAAIAGGVPVGALWTQTGTYQVFQAH